VDAKGYQSGDRAETEEEVEAEIGKQVLKTQSGFMCNLPGIIPRLLQPTESSLPVASLF